MNCIADPNRFNGVPAMLVFARFRLFFRTFMKWKELILLIAFKPKKNDKNLHIIFRMLSQTKLSFFGPQRVRSSEDQRIVSWGQP